MAFLKELEVYLKKYPLPAGIQHQYGTSGFRNKADTLPHVIFRTGILATLRARVCKGVIGVMITASHNPEEDNGVKVIDPSGGMMDPSWEALATRLANVSDVELESAVQEIVDKFSINMSLPGKVYIGRDTRPSSPSLLQALLAGISVAGGEPFDFGLLTTPQLHFIVRCANFPEYGEPTEEGYYKKLANAYLQMVESNQPAHLVLDCANGVGAIAMRKLAPLLQAKLTFDLIHHGDGILNKGCGADHVKVNQREPESVQLREGQRYVSFDGDADRIIYYYRNSTDNAFHMLDGDKLAVLMATYLGRTLKETGLGHIPITIVQTAYANSSSTVYMRDVLRLETDCVLTGVKHLHHRAEQASIGIYFEANGHGTILFSEEVVKIIKACQHPKARQLEHFIDLVNQTVGDAISDMLLVEAILSVLGMSTEQWDAQYTDLPSKLLKLEVKDRNVITTTDASRRCVTPAGLQEAIDQVVASYGSQARSFVRPSGTEDVVRIYAEAPTPDQVDKLAKQIGNLVYDFANGVGDKFVI